MPGRDKYWVDPDFLNTDHGDLGCMYCHKGNNVFDVKKAHTGLVKDPSDDKAGVCKECHEEITDTYYKSIHYTIAGIRNVMQVYISPQPLEKSPLMIAFKIDCNSCHASCGSCHISRPEATKGGLMGAHQFFKEPPMGKSCFGCHGARTSGEYTGKIGHYSVGDEEVPDIGDTADVHFYKYRMICSDCHEGEMMHQEMEKPDKARFYNLPSVQCEDCHKKAAKGKDHVPMHKAHKPDTLSCAVCHSSGGYHNCFECHVLVAQSGKLPVPLAESKIMFKIGLNPDRGPNNKFKYVLLRHSPVRPLSFSILGVDLSPNFDKLHTWAPITPHNIQRKTRQNAECNACHGHPEFFLTVEDAKLGSKADELSVSRVPEPVKEEKGETNRVTMNSFGTKK